MNQLTSKLRTLPAMLATAALLGSALVANVPGVVSAAGTSCPISISESGSTTVYPALVQAKSGFEAANGGCTLNLAATGSGAGITDVLNGTTDIAASSRPLKAGTESTNLYAWKVGGDAMVIAVRNSAAMSGVTSITSAQVASIYSGTLTSWSALGGSGTIVPRSRIIGSGSRDDLLRLFGITDVNEQATIAATGLARFQTSTQEATDACNNDNQVVYTSLANLQTYGPGGQNCLKALTLDGVAPSVQSVQQGTYPAPRTLFLVLRKSEIAAASATDSSVTKAMDLVNYMLSSAGQNAVGAVGFVQTAVPSAKPVVDYDVNLDGAVGLADIGAITGKWGQTSTCPGWIRADVTNDGAIGIADIGAITGKWGGVGFVAP